jgi:DNA-directed RNA polymerase specialized sigma subunit
MTNKEKIKYLRQYRILTLEHDIIKQRYIKLLHKFNYPAPECSVLSDMPKNFTVSNQIEANYIKLKTLEEMLQYKMKDLLTTQIIIEKAIADISDPYQKMILTLRYFEGLTFEKITNVINYSWKQIHRLHRKALDNINL